MARVTTGIVGCGGISTAHGNAIEGNGDRIDFAACCDVDAERAREYAERYDVSRTYVDYREMLAEEDLDLVILATWPNQHHEQVLHCVDAGVPAILCEKSLAPDSGDAAAMVEAAASAGTLLVEGFMYRHNPRILRFLELVEGGEIGPLRKIRGGFHMILEDESNWRRDPERAGGVHWDLTCYPVNACTALAGTTPERVAAEWNRRESDGLVEALWATMRYPDGTIAQIETSQTANYRQPLEAQGPEGTLYLEHAWSTSGVEGIEKVDADWADDFAPETVPTDTTDSYEAQVLHLCDCLESGETPRFTADESVRNVAVMEALLESAATGTYVEPEVPAGF